MATRHGQTGWVHEDYKVQREFERLSKQVANIDKPISIINNSISNPPRAKSTDGSLWALTVKHETVGNSVLGVGSTSKIVDEYSDRKRTQVLNFKDGFPRLVADEQVRTAPVKFKLKHREDIESDLRSITDAIEVTIEGEVKYCVPFPVTYSSSQSGYLELYFSYLDVYLDRKILIGNINKDRMIDSVVLEVIDIWDSDIKFTVGEEGAEGRLMLYDENISIISARYVSQPNYKYTVNNLLYVFVNYDNLPIHGTGRIVVYYH